MRFPVEERLSEIAAALAAKAGCTPRELDVKALQKTLLEQGACLA